ncbi:MAG: hypothetical protein J6U14_11120 [Bacteroidaceae bacterium]|nr:hypothetical protein [Bacteroidaceae bacterium]
MKKLLFILSVIMLACLTSCSKEETGLLPWLQDPEELSRHPVKPTVNETPITRPMFLSKEDMKKMARNGLRSYSWKLFRQLYEERQQDKSAQQNLLISPYNIITTLNEQVGDSNKLKKFELMRKIGINDCSEEVIEELYDHINTFLSLDDKVSVINDANNPRFKAHWGTLFKMDYTQEGSFRQADGSYKQMEMMISAGNFCYSRKAENYILTKVRIGSYLMLFFVIPFYGHSIDEVVKSFDITDLDMNFNRYFNFKVPKFSVQDSTSLDLSVFGENISIRQNVALSISEYGVNYEPEPWEKKTERREWMGEDFFFLDQPFIYGIIERTTNIPLYIGYYGY